MTTNDTQLQDLQYKTNILYKRTINVMQQLMPEFLTKLSTRQLAPDEFVKQVVDSVLFMTSLSGGECVAQITQINSLLAEIDYLRRGGAQQDLPLRPIKRVTKTYIAPQQPNNVDKQINETISAKLLTYFLFYANSQDRPDDRSIADDILGEVDPHFGNLVGTLTNSNDPDINRRNAETIINYIRTMSACKIALNNLQHEYKILDEDASNLLNEIDQLKAKNKYTTNVMKQTLKFIEKLPNPPPDVQNITMLIKKTLSRR